MRHIMLATLFTGFLRLGATAYGGPAMMAHLRQDFVGKRRWLSEEEFKEGMALCHMIPGATMVQMAAYVGYRFRGLPGALVAAVAFILPAFLLMIGLSAAYFRWGDLPAVRALFSGLGAIVVAIILNACVSLAGTILSGWRAAVLAALAFGALALRVHVVLVVVGAAVVAQALLGSNGQPGPAEKGGP